MRVPTPLLPDPVHLLSSLCDEALNDHGSRIHALPFFATAHGSHPIQWLQQHSKQLQPPGDAWAIGAVVEGVNQHGARVVAALVLDVFGRQRSLVYQDGEIHDIPVMLGDVITDLRNALGLDPAA